MNIVITGTYKGIGKKLAEHFLAKGDFVCGCSRHESTINHTNYRHFIIDVTDETAVNQFARDVKKEVGATNGSVAIDALINNAGIASMNHFLMTPMETSKNVMNVNYFGPVATIRAFLNLLKKSEHGRIVNFSTVAVALALEGELAYGSSKAAVESLTRVLAKEISVFGITVNALGPTPIHTDLIAKVPEEKLNKILAAQAIHRFGEVEDIINVIEFYLKPESDFITGQVIYLGGVS